MAEVASYLDPAVLAEIASLEIRARRIVQGHLAGMHRSPYQSFSVEFAQHREYAPGDDIKHVDWKVYGRTERHFVKQYEAETNLLSWLLVDVSESMLYASGAMSKYGYACTAAAALAYLILHQQDVVGLATFDAAIREFLRPSGQASHFKEIVRILEAGPGRDATSLAPVLHDFARRATRRGLVFVLSDLFDDLAELLRALKLLCHRGHEVVLFHVLDGAEIDFPFGDRTLFRGLEQMQDVLTDAASIRKAYLQEFEGYQASLERGCRENRIDYVSLRTDASLGRVLSSYLAHRGSRKKA